MADLPLRPLVPAEESWLAAELSAGRRASVHVLAASGDLPAGARARLLSAGPVAEGEYLIVEVKGDRLPFAASEIALPPTVARRVRRAAGVVDPPPKAPRRTTKASSARPSPQPVLAKTAARPPSAPSGSAAARPAPTSGTAPRTATAKAQSAKVQPVKASPAKAQPTKAAPAKPRARRASAPMSVILTFDGSTRWTVEARAGSRRVRPVEVPAGAAAAASHALGVPEVDALVSAITDGMRRDAEDKAASLRSQLAAAEAELARLSHS